MSHPKYDLNDIKKKVKKSLDKERYQHTLGVMYTAGCLAMAHESSMEDAMLAGLLHDCGKCLPNEDKIALCIANDILINDVEMKNPGLLHAKVGAYLAENRYGVSDPHILHAIKVHTTGEPNMSILDKIIFIADYIEPRRCEAPRLTFIRKLAFEDLDLCMAEILKDTLQYLANSKGNGMIDPATLMTYEFYRPFLKE